MRKINNLATAPMDKKNALNYKLNDNLAIKLDNLKIVLNEHNYNKTLILNETSVEFEKNKIYFIVGDSGTGKSTLVSHFNGIIKSKYGNIFILDSKIIGKKWRISKFKKLRKNVGMVFQFPEYQLFKDTILKDVMFGPLNLGIKKTMARELATIALERMGINKKLFGNSPFEISGGQKRRVAIAGILSFNPEILIFDEPTAGLDPLGTKEMLQTIKQLKAKNKTIFVITHDMDHVLELADKVIFIKNNKIEKIDEPYNIFKDKELLKNTTIMLPKIFVTINELCNKENKFAKLYDMKPKTINELADCISKIIKGNYA